MPSTFFGLDIGTSGLYTYQNALNTTAHNISNAETKGYSRQYTVRSAKDAISFNVKYGMVGTGVDTDAIERKRDEYYDIKYEQSNTKYGMYRIKSELMTQVESYFNEIGNEGFVNSFNNLSNSMQELLKDPSSLSIRDVTNNYATNFTDYFNQLYTTLQEMQDQANIEIKNAVQSINSYANQIAAITKQINVLEVTGKNANDLRDQRTLLVDRLSEFGNVEVEERKIGTYMGRSEYMVTFDGSVLVDTYEYNSLKVIARQDKVNQNDIEGLFDIYWADDQSFNMTSKTLGGKLQGLIEMRDGNNKGNLQGIASGSQGDNKVEVTDTNINSMAKMNMPQTGLITIGTTKYEYSGFSVDVDEDTGNYTYTFELESELKEDLEDGTKASVGDAIDYKGLNYYMSTLNEFIRTFSQQFNDIHRTGIDLNGEDGQDYFTAKDAARGIEYSFRGELLEDEINDDGSKVYDDDIHNHFTSLTLNDDPEYDGTILESNGKLLASYYLMTAGNVKVSNDILYDPSKFVTTTDINQGVNSQDVIDALNKIIQSQDMFKQGSPSSYLDSIVAEVGIDADEANNLSKHQENILNAIDQQRMSISSVDNDEEAMDLVKFRYAYSLSCKVISVMDEVYDKLINYMGA